MTRSSATLTIQALHTVDQEHLATVRSTMQHVGAPTIRAYWTGEMWQAIDGTHRLEAAAQLGLVPVIVEVAMADLVSHDIDDLANPCHVSDIAEYLGGMGGQLYHFAS